MRALVCSSLCLVAVACEPAAPPPGPPGPPAPASAVVSEDVGTTVVAAVGPEGGFVETIQGGITYRLEVPAGALDTETELTLTPARLVGIAGAVGARLEPAGTVFATPATLRISPPPTGEVLVALEDGAIPVEAALAVPQPDAVLVVVPHFSTHAAADARAAFSALPADVRAAVEALGGLSVVERAAVAIGEFHRSHLVPLLPLASQNVRGFETAGGAVIAWRAAIDAFEGALDELPHEIGGSETVGALRERVTAELASAGNGLLERLGAPSCTPTDDIAAVTDWATVPQRLAVLLATLGEPADFAPCLTSRVTVEGPTTLAEDTTELHLSLRHEVVGPPSDPRTAIRDASFSLEAVGAAGPELVADGNGGQVRDVVFTRATGPDRARVVTITVTGLSTDAQLGTIPESAPAVFTVAEPGTDVTVTATPALLERPSETAQVCSIVRVGGEPAQAFSVDYTVEGGGTLDLSGVVTTNGSACVTYTPPLPLPQGGGEVSVHAIVTVAGGELRGSTIIQLGSGGLALTLASTPGAATAAGEVLSVCATATSGDSPVPRYDVQFALAGPGQLGETGVITAIDPDGEACTTWVAPTPLGTGQVATVTAHATLGPFTANASLPIPLGEPPLVVVSVGTTNDPAVCGDVPEQHRAVATVSAPDTLAPLAGVEVAFLLDGAPLGTAATDDTGTATSPAFPAPAGTHVVAAAVGAAAGAETSYFASDAFACRACAGAVCGILPGSPVVTVCAAGDGVCAASAFCACLRQGSGCRQDGPFTVDFTDPASPVEIHCRGD